MGPPGSYSEQAAIMYGGDSGLVPVESIPAVARAISSGDVDEGVIPIENSIEGAVTFTLDLLIHESDLKIKSEVAIPIHHSLMARDVFAVGDIEVVYSHPQSFAQCRFYLSKNLPRAELVAAMSNSRAVEQMMQSGLKTAAIASERAARLYGASLLASRIEDSQNNETRFIVLAVGDHESTGSDKTSLCFDFAHDSPGILYNVLGEFFKRGINLLKIESRPTRKSLGRYVFLVDIEGHRTDSNVSEALAVLREHTSMLKIMGSYPMNVTSAVLDPRTTE